MTRLLHPNSLADIPTPCLMSIVLPMGMGVLCVFWSLLNIWC